METYLDLPYDNKYKRALTQFRISSHNLNIKSGRHINLPRDQRLCSSCNMNMIENEYHFYWYILTIQHCEQNTYCNWPTVNKCSSLMQFNLNKNVIQISKYIYFANKMRKDP